MSQRQQVGAIYHADNSVYTEAEQTAILSLQRQGGRLVRMRPDGKRPAYKWGGRTGRCLTQHQAESWLRINGRFALVPYSIGFSVLDIDAGPWQNLTAVYPPHAVIPSRKLWRRHLYYSDSEPRSNAQKRKLYGCHVDVRSASGYVALWKPENVLEAAEGPRQGVLFPWRMFWPEEGANKTPPGKTPPGKPPAPPGGNPRDGPLNDAYPLTRWNRLLEVVKAWAYIHAREYNKRDTFHFAIRKYAEGRALEMPDLTDFWDGSTNDPAKSAYYVESHAWQFWRPVHAANRRWHNKSNYDLGGRDTSLTAMREKGLNQKEAASLHGLTQGQVSKRLSGGGTTHEGYSMHISVTCRSCKTVFLAARASARFCGSTCRQRAKRAKKGA